jgi:hypothetical protein
MIVQLRQKKPFLHFGFNRQSVETFTGQTLTIYQDTIYNKDYIFNWSFSGGILISESVNQLVLKTDNIELISVSVNVNGIKSDPIEIDCKAITADTNRITADSNTATADGSII